MTVETVARIPLADTASPPPPGRPRIVAVGWLGLMALADEILLTACLVAAIAAVVAPIMVLAALKFGFIEIMRSRLIEDPVFRQITPTVAVVRPPDFFEALRRRRDVAFLLEEPNLTRSSARLGKKGATPNANVDFAPTADGDPIVVENGGRIPADNEVTLSSRAAEGLGVKPGDEVVLRFSRASRGSFVTRDVPLTVVSVLSPRAAANALAYLNRTLVDDIELNKIGTPIPSRQWAGDPQPPAQTFERVLVGMGESLNETDRRLVAVQNGFSENVVVLTPETARTEAGLTFQGFPQILALDAGGKPVRAAAAEQLLRNFGDRHVAVVPLVSTLSAEIAGTRIPLSAASPSDLPLPVTAGSVEGWKPWTGKMAFGEVDRLALPAAIAEKLGIALNSRIDINILTPRADKTTRELGIRLIVDAFVDGDRAFIHSGLAGMLNEARQNELVYDRSVNSLVVRFAGYQGYRLHARSIDEVPGLVRQLKDMSRRMNPGDEEGEEVRSQSQTIERLQKLDGALTRMVALVAAVALVGGGAVMVASFYGAVERKESELALLRLMGFERWSVFQFPVIQAAFVALAGFAFAALLYWVFSTIINTNFAADLQVGERICRLPANWFLLFLGGTLVLAIFASFAGAMRATRIDPAEALRRE